MSSTLKMPFGKHKDKYLDDVPANYLVWLSEQDFTEDKYPQVWKYINDNMKAIRKQIEDGRGDE